MKTFIVLLATIFTVATAYAQTHTLKKIVRNGNTIDTLYIMPGPGEEKSYVEELPAFAGDIHSYLKRNMKYPEDAKEKHIHGTVEIAFNIDKKGILSNIHVEQPLYPSLDAEALRLVKAMPPWKPAIKDNQPVKGTWYVDISFD